MTETTQRSPRITLREVEILWPNFGAGPTKFRPEGGIREFNVKLTDGNLVENLLADGWNVKALPIREEGDELAWTMVVKVNYRSSWPPEIHAMYPTTMRDLLLSEETVAMLDTSRIQYADVIINSHEWEPGRLSGYVQKMWATIDESEFDIKYADYNPVGE